MSTTIHVTIPDHTEALGVVATLLNQGYQVSIDLDVVPTRVEPDYMDSAEVKIREKLWGDDAMLRRQMEREQCVVAYGAKVGFDGNDYWINGMKVSAREFDREMKMRAHAREERAMLAAQAIEAAPCPKCGADRGQRCMSAGGHTYGTRQVHLDRELRFDEMRRDDAHPVV